MTLSLPGIISALAMKPIPPMIARSIANNFASMAAESAAAGEATPERPAEASPDVLAAAGGAEEIRSPRALDQRA